MRAGRCFTENAPKPRSSTLSPRASAFVISSKITLTICSTCLCIRCGLPAESFSISSDFIIEAPFLNCTQGCQIENNPSSGRSFSSSIPARMLSSAANPSPSFVASAVAAEAERVDAGLRFRLPVPNLEAFLDLTHVREPFDGRFFVADGVDQAVLKRLPAGVDAAGLDLVQGRVDALAPLLHQATNQACDSLTSCSVSCLVCSSGGRTATAGLSAGRCGLRPPSRRACPEDR